MEEMNFFARQEEDGINSVIQRENDRTGSAFLVCHSRMAGACPRGCRGARNPAS